MISKILVPTDGSRVARKAAMYAVDLAKQLKATVIALSIIDKRSFMGQTVPVPVAMRSYGFSVGNVCERDMTLLEGKTNG